MSQIKLESLIMTIISRFYVEKIIPEQSVKPGGHEFGSHPLWKRLSHLLLLKGGTFAKWLAADIGTRPMNNILSLEV